MKKALSFIAAAFVAVSMLSSCGTKDKAAENNQLPAETQETVAPSGNEIVLRALAEAGLIKADRTPKPIILDFNAVWCGPCQEFAPVFEAAAEKYGDKVDFISVDVDKYQDLSGLMGVESIPNVIVLNADGSLNRNIVGTGDLLPAEKFDAIVTSLL
jgi:thioredoxin